MAQRRLFAYLGLFFMIYLLKKLKKNALFSKKKKSLMNQFLYNIKMGEKPKNNF